MLKLERIGNRVLCNERELTIVAQTTKGPGQEVVKVEGLEGSNGQKWISLKKLHEGMNEVATKGSERTSTGSYTLTPTEKTEIDKLQARIDEIKTQAKKRYVPTPKFVDPSKLTPAERLEKATEIEKYLMSLKAIKA